MNTYDEITEEKKDHTTTYLHSKNKESEAAFQFTDKRPKAIDQKKLQEMASDYTAKKKQPVKKQENNTGLPDQLKMGVETLSGYSMDDVKVHYNSNKPSQMQAHAFAQGTEIHLATEQEKHLPHEAWHVVQQKQGRVKPTMFLKDNFSLNNDVGLESEADVMGAKVLRANAMNKSMSKNGNGISSKVNSSSSKIVQGVFSQNPVPNLKNSYHGGVHSQYDTAQNMIELHIDAGANQNGTMMQDFLTALWEARDTVIAGQARNPGGVFMRPGGSQVLKTTMEMLGEAIGQGPQLGAARNAKTARRIAGLPLWVDPTGNNAQDDILDATVVPENIAYRNSMIGVAGITMNPIGGGTSGGVVDMLPANAAAAAERALYDAALIGLTPFISIAININLAILNQVITMLEGQIGFLKLLYLKALYAKKG